MSDEESKLIVRSVEWYGTAFVWNAPDGVRRVLDPTEVEVLIGADQQTEREELNAEIAELRAAYERVVAERDEAQRARVALKQTIDAFPDANNAANLAHARAERDRLRSDLNQATAGHVAL